MKKTELITKLSERLEVTKKDATAIIDGFNEICKMVAEDSVGTKVKVGDYVTIEKVHVEERTGTCAGRDYVKPAHDELAIKRTDAAKNI